MTDADERSPRRTAPPAVTPPAAAPPPAATPPGAAVPADATRGATGPAVRDRILAAARRQLAATGEVSMNEVAAEAGVARQTVHYHFGGLRGLRAALAAEGLAEPADDEPTRERLLDAAQRLLSKPEGWIVSIEAIAAEAGLTKGAVYHNFADRADLLQALAERVSPVNEIADAIPDADEVSLRDGLVALTAAYFSAMTKRTSLIRGLAANASRDPLLVPVVMGKVLGRGVPLVLAWLETFRARGELREDVDPTLLVQALIGPVFMAIVIGPEVFARMAEFGIHPAAQNVEAYVDLVLRGVAANPPDPAVTSQSSKETR